MPNNSICATSTQGVLLNNLYYYPAKQCLFNQPATLITNTPITQVGNCANPGGSGNACQTSSMLLAGVQADEVNPRPGHAVFYFAANENDPLKNGLKEPLTGDQAPQPISDGPDANVLFTRDYTISKADANGQPIDYQGGVIRVFYIAYYVADNILDPKQPLAIQVRGVGQELEPKLGDPSKAQQLQVIYRNPNGYYVDCNLIDDKGGLFSAVPHDVFTRTPIKS